MLTFNNNNQYRRICSSGQLLFGIFRIVLQRYAHNKQHIPPLADMLQPTVSCRYAGYVELSADRDSSLDTSIPCPVNDYCSWK
ncbi:hypothetical protein [Paenibacillus bovis]|uniref:hypothetical protein n=1 Tax=Paenibacillus bovis TaxID=1616788 RepID=UPI001314B5C5|nr:hypothetical protein [Paenibacillus bovis]